MSNVTVCCAVIRQAFFDENNACAYIFTLSTRKIGSKGDGFIIRDGSGRLYVGCSVCIYSIFFLFERLNRAAFLY